MRLIIFLFFLASALSSYGDINQQTDSLLVLLKKEIAEDTTRLQRLNKVGNAYDDMGRVDSSRLLLGYANALADKIISNSSDSGLIKRILADKGTAYISIGETYPSGSIEQYKSYSKALDIFKQIQFSYDICYTYDKFQQFCNAIGYYDKTLEYGAAGLKIALQAKDTFNIKQELYQNGKALTALKRYDKAVASVRQQMTYYKNKSGEYFLLANLFSDEKKCDSALYYAGLVSLDISTEYTAVQSAGVVKSTVPVYLQCGDTASALRNLYGALAVFEKYQYYLGAGECCADLSGIYFDRYDLALAERFAARTLGHYAKLNGQTAEIIQLDSSTTMDDDLKGLNADKAKLYRLMADIYAAKKDYRQSYKYESLFRILSDTLQDRKSNEERIQMQHQFELNKVLEEKQLREEELAREMQRQRFIRYGISSGLLILLVFSIVLFLQKQNVGKEKKRSDDLLLNILPAEIARELKEKGTAEARMYDNVTVLFTDFVSFTTISEHLTPQQLVDELHTCFSAFDRICEKYHIEKVKTVGDAYLAISGLPLPNPNHAEDMVKAAIEIRDYISNRRHGVEGLGLIRIGLHSGSVVAGIVGVKKFAYDIWGDTVNTAARMEQNSEAGKINISQTTYELVKDKFICTYRGEIEAKNKGKLKMYFIEPPLTSKKYM